MTKDEFKKIILADIDDSMPPDVQIKQMEKNIERFAENFECDNPERPSFQEFLIKLYNKTPDLPWTKIQDFTFFCCDSLTNFNIPKSIKIIGDYAFGSCTNLKTVNLNDGLKSVGEHAFSNCKNLQNINFPQSLRSIGDFAFHDCTSLHDIELPDNNALAIWDTAFGYCTGLKTIGLPNIWIFGSDVFEGCTCTIYSKVHEDDYNNMVASLKGWATAFNNFNGRVVYVRP